MAPRTTNEISSRDQVLSREAIESLIAQGRKIFIFEGLVLRVDAFIPYHPGGDKAILHMVGRDATDEVSCMHPPEALDRMRTYKIGRIEDGVRWKNFLPPIQGGVFRDYSKEQVEDCLEAQKLGKSSVSEGGIDNYEAEGSSTASSRSESPVFDQESEETGVRLRARSGSVDAETSSISSISDIDEKLSRSMEEPKLSHLDTITKEAIDLDLAKYPPLDPASQAEIQAKYRALYQRIIDEGLFQCNYWAYGAEVLRYLLLFSLFLFFLKSPTWYSPSLSGLFLGCMWHQLVFTAHDAGHMGITHSFIVDTTIGIIIADFIGGLSLGWWKRSHNIHHIVTNSTRHDPDIQHLPFFAVSHDFFNSLYSTYHDHVMSFDNRFSQWFVARQAWLYYPILAFGRFNLYVQSWIYLLSGQAPSRGPAWWTRWLEIAGQLFFMWWFWELVVHRALAAGGNWDRLAFVMVSHVVTMPLHVQITLSHFAMSTADLGVAESFPQRMLRTTMDVDCPEWLDFFHGGLQFQAVHHLYPRIPRHNLRRTQKLVMRFCEDVGIPYALFGFVEGNRTVIGKLGEVGRQAAILAECQRTVAKTGHWD